MPWGGVKSPFTIVTAKAAFPKHQFAPKEAISGNFIMTYKIRTMNLVQVSVCADRFSILVLIAVVTDTSKEQDCCKEIWKLFLIKLLSF